MELAPLADPNLVPQAVASSLGVREAPDRAPVEVLIEHLRPKRVLLVLDNCEHLIEECAALVDNVLRTCLDLKILATSREALGIAGERTWVVPPLSLPDIERLPSVEEASRYEAVRLFDERARAVTSTFELKRENASVVAQLCQRLEGVPLAIELAAARTKVLSVEQILKRLGDSLKVLTGTDWTAPERQRTLRGTLDWSYELLDEQERKLFERLSMFAGGWTLEAAEAVGVGDGIEEDEVLELLTHLVDKSLVVAEAGAEGTLRYRMLEPVRQYAWERLEESEEEATRDRHAAWCLGFAENAERGLGGPDQPGWLEKLETEHDNLRSALTWLLGEGDAQLGLRLAAALWPFWYTHAHLSEGRSWLESAISKDCASMTRTKAKALNGAGYISLFEGEYEAAKRFLDEGLALYRELGDKEGIASSLIYLGFVAVLDERDLDTIPALYEEAASLQSELGDRRVVANLLLFSGLISVSQGEMERASALQEESLALFRHLGDVQGMGHCLNNLGGIAISQGEHEKASRFALENLRMAREADYKLAIQYSLLWLGFVATSRKQPAHAARLWGAVESMEETFGIRLTRMARSATDYDGRLAVARSQLDEAAWEAAWQEGQAMTPEEAIEYALEASPSTSRSRDETALLSERELEILRLVAQGLTDPQVAEKLYLSPRTVGQHLRSIYRKLGVPSRAAAAKEAVERSLI